MRVLLDTHAALWAFATPGELSDEARALLVDPGTTVLLSAVTSWEVAIKRGIGRLRFDGDIAELGDRHRFDPLPVTHAHAARIEQLPAVHRDPFDRLLVAQAQVEDAAVVTRDPALADYDIETIRC